MPNRGKSIFFYSIGLAMIVRIPLSAKKGRRVRICLYARYSTEEQRRSSIDDQFAFLRECLEEWEVIDVEIETICDEGLSGELRDRPGINRVRQGVAQRLWDVILCEDSSRLFRGATACGDLVEHAVDQNIRVICVNDGVDTEEPDWPDRLHSAQQTHGRDNFYTRSRIKRRHNALWTMGAAIGMLKPGYTRRASVPATDREPEEGPFFDEIDSQSALVIYEAFERIAKGDAPYVVSEWLTEVDLRKCANALHQEWTAKNTIELIRRTIYRGHDQYRRTINVKKYTTGHSKPARNAPEKILTREMEHLRIVPDWLWYRANEALDERCTRETTQCGEDHPLFGIPRDSRLPLSNLFFCAICEEKMWSAGRNEGGYRCRTAYKHRCWNKATVLRDLTHERIGRSISEEMLSLNGHVDVLIDYASTRLKDDSSQKELLKQHQQRETVLVSACDRLLKAIEFTSDDVGSLVQRRSERLEELAQVRAELEKLEAGHLDRADFTPQEIRQRIDEVASHLLELNNEVNGLLRQLIPDGIHAVPYQRIDCNMVVLRAEFEISLYGILPEQLTSVLSGDLSKDDHGDLMRRRIVVDLFEEPPFITHAAKTWSLMQEEMTLQQIADTIGIAKHRAHLGTQVGRMMEKAGTGDPYVRLTEPPENASRWRRRQG